MDTFDILVVNTVMALGTDLSNGGFFFKSWIAIRIFFHWRLGMGIMAVYTNRRIRVSLVRQHRMGAVLQILCQSHMAVVAGVFVLLPELLYGLSGILRMGIARNIHMAVPISSPSGSVQDCPGWPWQARQAELSGFCAAGSVSGAAST